MQVTLTLNNIPIYTHQAHVRGRLAKNSKGMKYLKYYISMEGTKIRKEISDALIHELQYTDLNKQLLLKKATNLHLKIQYIFYTKNKKKDGCFKNSMPDLDNLTKGILDLLETNNIIYNDAYIVSLSLEKGWEYNTSPSKFKRLKCILTFNTLDDDIKISKKSLDF